MSNFLLVAGSREFEDYEFFRSKILEILDEMNIDPTDVNYITGRANNGPDDMVYHFAKWELKVKPIEFPADWDNLGKKAGMVRNSEMAKFLKGKENTRVVIFWTGESKGTKQMISECKSLGLNTNVIYVDPIGILDRVRLL